VRRVRAGVAGDRVVSRDYSNRIEEDMHGAQGAVLLLSGATYGAGGGNQRPSAMARAFAAMGWTAIHYNHSRLQRGLRCDGVWCVAQDDWPSVAALPRPDRGIAIIGLPAYAEDARVLARRGWTVVYDIMDDWPAFAAGGMIASEYVAGEEALAREADFVTATCRELCLRAQRMGLRRAPVLLPNAGPGEAVCGDRYGGGYHAVFAGHLQNTWLDWSLLEELSGAEGLTVHVIGDPGRVPRGYPNFVWHGEMPYRDALAVMAKCHVGLIPFSGPIAACVDALKYYDYAAAGLWSVVSPGLLDMAHRRFCVVGRPGEYLEAVLTAIQASQGDVPSGAWLQENSWQARCRRLLYAVEEGEADDRGEVRPRVSPAKAPEGLREGLVDYDQWKLNVAWACTTRCNADPVCPYCCTEPHRAEYGSGFSRPPDEILDGFLRLTRDHGPLHLLSGWGDGMADDEVASLLGQIARYNRVDITSNLRFPKDRVELLPRNRNVDFCLSFHPHLWDGIGEFLDKAKWLVGAGFPVGVVGIVAYPPYLEHLRKWCADIADAGFTHGVMAYQGEWEGRFYPAAYSPDEWKLILPLYCEPTATGIHKGLAQRTEAVRGRLCDTGHKYVYLDWLGNAHRCVSNVYRGDGSLGDLWSGVKLWTAPRECQCDVCGCTDLWRYIYTDGSV